MKHLIITGGAGFIGSHLCEAFLDRGYAVTAVDNLITGSKRNITGILSHPHFDFLEKDICQPWTTWAPQLKGLKQHGLAGILHFACPASPVDFERIPFDILAVDSLGTQEMVDMALKYTARLVLASTSEIYGDPLEHPQKESYWGNVNSIGPRACYDETKRFAEAYVSAAIRGVGLYRGKPFQALDGGMVRIFNTYGPRMRPDDGRIVPEMCIQALKSLPLTIHGQGLQTRSFCYVDDLVEGIRLYYEKGIHEPVNLGNPKEFTVMDFAKELQKITQSKSSFTYLPERPDDPRRRCPDIKKAQQLLGWQPKVSLTDGLRLSLDYFRSLQVGA